MARRADGSMPDVGSSSITTCRWNEEGEGMTGGTKPAGMMLKDVFTLESPMRAMPMDSFLFIPPDKVLERACRLSSRFRIRRILSTSAGILSVE